MSIEAVQAEAGVFDGVRHSAARDAAYRRSRAVADVFAAALALTLAIQVFGDDRLRGLTLLGLSLVVVVSKIIGLYDRDELLLHKSTVDEVPKLFTLAAIYTLTIDIASRSLIAGNLGRDQLLGMWLMFFASVVTGRSAARVFARERTDEERIIIVGELADCDAVAEKLESHHKIKASVVTKLPLKPRREGESY